MIQSETKSSVPKMDPQKFTVDTRYNEIPINCIFQGIANKLKFSQINNSSCIPESFHASLSYQFFDYALLSVNFKRLFYSQNPDQVLVSKIPDKQKLKILRFGMTISIIILLRLTTHPTPIPPTIHEFFYL